ncbi:MAG: GNAT family N-acetyltransferase [Pseudomonadota bacterium]
MKTIIYEDRTQCQSIWEKIWPARGIFDLWQVRSCFHDSYSRPLLFHTVEENGKPLGFLPLCWNEESNNYLLFPGETWQGKSWLEQNQLIAKSPKVIRKLLDSVQGSLNMRYLTWNPLMDCLDQTRQDGISYLFFPGNVNYSMDNYWNSFSGKSRKKLKSALKQFQDREVSFRFNHVNDLEALFRMNMEYFSEYSYFTDSRFHRSFERLAAFLWEKGMLRITTVLIGKKVAAVDMGAIFKNNYTLLAGGTNPEFPGVAKLINLHHLEWSCLKKFDSVDFLCGDFNWKKRFHLTPRPLYEISLDKAMTRVNRDTYEKKLVYA